MHFFGLSRHISVPLGKVFRAMKSIPKPHFIRYFFNQYLRLPWQVVYWIGWGLVIVLVAYLLHLYFEYRHEELQNELKKITLISFL
jgi:hypothetical protein